MFVAAPGKNKIKREKKGKKRIFFILSYLLYSHPPAYVTPPLNVTLLFLE
jgi:hypothetical protein